MRFYARIKCVYETAILYDQLLLPSQTDEKEEEITSNQMVLKLIELKFFWKSKFNTKLKIGDSCLSKK